MAVTDWKMPGSCVNADRDGKTGWTNTAYASGSDGQYTRNNVVGGTYSDWLRVYNFGFTASDIPSGATIDGIEVEIERYAAAAANIVDDAIYTRNGVLGQTGPNHASGDTWPDSDGTQVYGGPTDRWGTGWGFREFQYSGFGFDISVKNEGSTGYAYIDNVRVRLYYTVVRNRLANIACEF